jgi:hypothetical protein
MFFKWTFDPVHVIPVSIRHPSKDLVGARSGVSEKHVRNASHDFASVELVHRLIPQFHKSPRRYGLWGLRQNGGTDQVFCWRVKRQDAELLPSVIA